MYLLFTLNLIQIVGLVTSRDVDFIDEDRYPITKISEVMVPLDRLITGSEDLTLEHAYKILENEKKGKWLFINFVCLLDIC